MEIALSFVLLVANFVVMMGSAFVGLTVIMLTAILCMNIINTFVKE